MIDFNALNRAYNNDSFYALQLEVGDKCFQNCIYCYMNALKETQNELSDEIIFSILSDARKLEITAIEWLGGEPLLRPGIFSFMEYARELGFRNNMWTGGLPLADKTVVKKLSGLCKPGLISFHLSTLNPSLYETLHPERSAKDIEIIISGVKNLLETGYPAENVLNSITFTGLQPADDTIETMEYFYKEFNIQTSINVYHTYLRPGYHKSELTRFIPDKKDVAAVYKKYESLTGVRPLPMNCVNKQYCSATLAVLNNGYVTPCATIRDEKEGLNVRTGSFSDIVRFNKDYLCFKFLKEKQHLHEDCRKCGLNDHCWGCRSRSYAAGKGLYDKDPVCFRKP